MVRGRNRRARGARGERVLALDYGERRIGLALTDPAGAVALARGVMATSPLRVACARLRALARAEGVAGIVLGMPLTRAGTEGHQAARVRAFGAAVAHATGLPVEYVDERFTSADAARAARLSGQPPDAEAARLILEGWLAKKAGPPAGR